MIPQPGQKVQLIFKNGTRIEGIVDSWSPGLSILSSLVGPNKMLIHQTQQEVLLTQIIFESEEEKLESAQKLVPEISTPYPELAKFKSVPEVELSPAELRTQKLVELRRLQKQADQEEVRAKLTTFTQSAPNTKDHYVLPGILANIKLPGQKIAPSPGANPARLSNMSGKFGKSK